MPSTEIAHGSLFDVSNKSGQSIAEIFARDLAAIVMIDISYSMTANDCPNGEARADVACRELRKLQARIPGKIAVVEWAHKYAICLNGIPSPSTGETTDMAGVLRFIHRADDCGIQLILISDGHPQDEFDTLNVARTFKSKIDTLFIGPESDPGADFMRRLSALTGGKAQTQSPQGMVNLADQIDRLLTA